MTSLGLKQAHKTIKSIQYAAIYQLALKGK
jgi:hypothetical protein